MSICEVCGRERVPLYMRNEFGVRVFSGYFPCQCGVRLVRLDREALIPSSALVNLAAEIEAQGTLSPIVFSVPSEDTDNDLMPVAEAMRYADLWAAGKMIGGDIDGVCLSLRAEVLRLRAALEEQWLIVHDEHCTNRRDCTSFGGMRQCQHPRL